MAKKVQNLEGRAETTNLLCRNGHWHLRATVKGVRIEQSLRTTDLEEARLKRNAILGPMQCFNDERDLLKYVQRQLVGIDDEEEKRRATLERGIALKDVLTKWERNPNRRQCKEQQLKNHQSNWRKFLKWMAERHPEVQYCRQINRTTMQEWAIERLDGSRTSETYNKHLASVKYILGSMEEYDESFQSPAKFLKKKRTDDSISKEPFTEEELRAIFSAPDDEFVRLCAIGLYTTLRLGSARMVQWEMIAPDLEILRAVHDKTGADATQRIAQELKEILARTPAGKRSGPVCPNYAAMSKSDAAKKVQEMLNALGIRTHRMIMGINGKARRACIKGFHSFRHTAITLALRNGATIQQVKRLAGHKSEGMQARYTHLGAEDAGRANSLIGRFW